MPIQHSHGLSLLGSFWSQRFDPGGASVITRHETTARTCARRRACRVLLPARLQKQSHRPGRRTTRDWPMDRRWRLSVSDRYRMQPGGRVWTRPVPTTDHPRLRHFRSRRHVPHRGWAHLDRTGTPRTFFRIDSWFTHDSDRPPHRRSAPESLLLDDAHECWDVPHSMRVVPAFAAGFCQNPDNSYGRRAASASRPDSSSNSVSREAYAASPAEICRSPSSRRMSRPS